MTPPNSTPTCSSCKCLPPAGYHSTATILNTHTRDRYLNDFRKHAKVLKKLKASKGDKHERKKEQKRIETTRQHLKVLIKYINKDYADIKKRSVRPRSVSAQHPFPG